MTDYEIWLNGVKAAVESVSSKRAVARWLAERTGRALASTEVKLHRVLSGVHVPQADFSLALDAWIASGCPVTPLTDDGRKTVSKEVRQKRASLGGQARSASLSQDERLIQARKARSARSDNSASKKNPPS